ncbi:unnamed protein product [Leptosia nina]|uniref:Lipase domain-containing protein n=1 Tax=Leptosia nina TaxID=320188 RepID=A0AAV1JY64_9NEOP
MVRLSTIEKSLKTCESLPFDALASSQVIPELKFFEFTKSGKRKFSLTKAHTRSFAPDSQLLVYIPGWWNTPTDESSEALVRALLGDNPSVLILDTRESFSRGYVSSALQVSGLAYTLFSFIKNLSLTGFPVTRIHLIGFSLGAHVAGIAGRLVKKKLNRSLQKITALDPARPCFLKPSSYRLKRDDASFVYVLHTSSGVVGLEQPLGHVDVYANGVDSAQPECKDRAVSVECDHAQAWKLFSASVGNDSLLVGAHCATWEELEGKRCSGDRVNVGYRCSPQTRGLYVYTSQANNHLRTLRVFNPFDIRTWFHG